MIVVARKTRFLLMLVGALMASADAAPSLTVWPTDPSLNLPIATNPFTHVKPQIAPDGAGGAIIVWEDVRQLAPDSIIGDIYAQRVSGAGEILWTIDGESVGAVTQGEGPLSPQIVSDGDFGAIVAWEDKRSGTDWDVYAQRVDAFGSRVWNDFGIPICAAANDQVSIQMTSDEQGGAIITWVDFRGGYYSDVYAQRIDRNGTILWASNGVPVSTATRDQTQQRIVSDGAHGAIIVWEDERNNTSTARDIFAQRIDEGGTLRWTVDGTPICVAEDIQEAPSLTANKGGAVIIAWRDWRAVGDAGDVYAQRVDREGEGLWALNGIAVCIAPDTQFGPRLLSDPESGAYLCWTDRRSGNADVYAQRIDSLGASRWIENGIPVCNAASNQNEPQFVSDGRGGVIIAWADGRSEQFTTDIYAQRINPNGSTLWTPGGVPVSTVPERQYRIQLVADDLSGAIVTWEDGRGGILNEYDVYAQRVDSVGALSTPTGIESSNDSPAFELSPPIPNPGGGVAELGFYLPTPSEVVIEIYDVVGRLVRSERIGTLGRGQDRYVFNGEDDAGNTVPSGVYFARVSAGNQVRTQKFVISR
jgi:hypothetical protein